MTRPANASTQNTMLLQVPTNFGQLINTVYLNNDDSALTNYANLQAALNKGGDVEVYGNGSYLISQTLIIGGNTTLKVHPAVEIKGAVGCTNLIATSIIGVAQSSITVAWSSGMTATVTWTAHGLTAKDKVWIVGANQYQFLGVFTIASITDANTFVINLRRLPTATGSGTITAIKALENITVQGGTWNYNYTGGNDGTGYVKHVMLLGGVYNITVKDIDFEDTSKYGISLGAVDGAVIENITSRKANSDLIKVYGPSFNVYIRNLHADCGDDIVSFQVKEPSAYAAYIWTFGDIINCSVDGVSGLSSTLPCVIYPNVTGIIDNISISNVNSPGAVTINANDAAAATANVGAVRVINKSGDTANIVTLMSSSTLMTVQSLYVENPSSRGANTGRLVNVGANNINANIEVVGGVGSGVECLLNNSSTGTVNFSIRDYNVMSSWNEFSIAGAGTTIINIDNLIHAANPGSHWLNSTGAGTIVFNVRNMKMASGVPVVAITGGATITAFGGGLVIDLASLSRTSAAQMCIAAVNAGTILAGNMAVNDATNAANSWKQMSNTTLVY